MAERFHSRPACHLAPGQLVQLDMAASRLGVTRQSITA